MNNPFTIVFIGIIAGSLIGIQMTLMDLNERLVPATDCTARVQALEVSIDSLEREFENYVMYPKGNLDLTP